MYYNTYIPGRFLSCYVGWWSATLWVTRLMLTQPSLNVGISEWWYVQCNKDSAAMVAFSVSSAALLLIILSYLIWNSLEYFSQGSLMMRMWRCAVCSPWSKGNMATQSRREERPRRPGIWNPANICFRFQNPRTARILPLLYGKLQRKAFTSQERKLL